MSYDEKKLCSEFSKFRRKNPKADTIKFTCAIEFKVKKGKKRLNLTHDFQPQQLPALNKVETGCYYYKISDLKLDKSGFDSFQLCYSPAFVGVCWYTPRKPRYLYLIDIKDILKVKDSGQKSISEEEAEELAVYKLDLKTT